MEELVLNDLTPPAVIPEMRPLLMFNPDAYESAAIKFFIKDFKPCEIPFHELPSKNLTEHDQQHCFVDLSTGQHTSKFDREHGFVIGTVREPCQEYLKIWKAASEKNNQVLTTLDNQGAPQHLYGSSPPFFNTSTDTESFQVWASHPKIHGSVSERFFRSYSTSLQGVDCMVFMEDFESSFLRCLRKYEEQGGFIKWNSTKLVLLESIEDEKNKKNENEGTEDGGNPGCQLYFDQGLQNFIQNGPESSIYKQLGYGSCCSMDHFEEPLLDILPLEEPSTQPNDDFATKMIQLDTSAISLLIILVGGVLGTFLSVRRRKESHQHETDVDGLASWANPLAVLV